MYTYCACSACEVHDEVFVKFAIGNIEAVHIVHVFSLSYLMLNNRTQRFIMHGAQVQRSLVVEIFGIVFKIL